MEGIVLSNLDKLVKNPEVMSYEPSDDLWNAMSYEVCDIKGTCILTAESTTPPDITFVPGLTGWYKIFVASWRLDGGFAVHLKLDTDPVFTIINDSAIPAGGQWQKMEWVEEHFWCCADLTDREIIMRKNETLKRLTPLVWLRCVPMTEDEVAEWLDYASAEGRRNLHVHFDTDHNVVYGSKRIEDTLMKLYSVKNTDTKICTQEVLDHLYAYQEDVPNPRVRHLMAGKKRYEDACRAVAANLHEITKARLDLMHGMGVKLYAGLRMSMASFVTPWGPLLQKTFVNEHPEFYCKTRDGRTTAICSYAYPEVRRYVIDFLKFVVSLGYDGVSLIAHRGIHIAFEQPVLDEFARRYDGLDARRVPMDDPRLKAVWCGFLTEFVRDLHTELDAEMGRHVPINVITDFDPDTAMRIGIDVETLAKEGLIDHICGDNMEVFEDLGTCLGEDGLFNMEKYEASSRTRYMVRRVLGGDAERIKKGYPKYLEIAEKYGVEFFGGMTSSCRNNPQKMIEWWGFLRELGVKNFSVFNFCHSSQDRPVSNAITKTGHETVNMEYCTPKYYRVLSIDGYDISTYPPNWVG